MATPVTVKPIVNNPSALLPWETVQSAQPIEVAQSSPGIIGAAQNVNPTTATAQNVVLNPTTDTTAGQVRSIIAQDSPLMQQATSRANQFMNSRGLINSSMAAGSAQDAVISAAVPIANADATAYRGVNQQNMDTRNKFAIANADTLNKGQEFNATTANTLNLEQARMATNINQANTQAQNSVIINQLDTANKIQLGDIQASYETLIQGNKSAQDLFNITIQAINNIRINKDMTTETKQQAVDQQIKLLKAGLNMSGSIVNLNLGETLNFSV